MDKITMRKQIVRNLVKRIADMVPSLGDVENQTIIDDERGHYLLYSVGWEDSRWVYGSYVHIDVRPDGKVWLQHDGTDLRIADQLIENGIPKNEIVVGFQAPHARALMDGFAVA